MNWSFQSWSVSDFHLNSSNIDVNPVGQRPSVSPNPIGGEEPSKQQGIINTILKGGDIGEIKLVETPDGEYKYESIDGGNRKRAILSFLSGNEFPTHKSSVVGEKYVNQLTDEERETLMQYKMRFIIYPPMTTRQKGETFRDTNNTTPVNQQETLNSYGDIPIANLIRNTSRTVPGMGNPPHELFESYFTNPGNNEVFKNVGFNNNRLAIDEIVARITHMIYKGEKLTTASFDELQSMYDDASLDEKAVKTLKKKLYEFLDFALKVSVSRKQKNKGRGIAKGHMTALYRLWFYLKQEYGQFKVEDFDKFWAVFIHAFNSFDHKSPLRTEVVEKNKDGTGGRLIFEAFNGYLGDHKTQRKIDQQVKWFLEEFDMDAATIIFLDKVSFSRHDIEVMLARQGYKDWVDGTPLTMEDAEGGHIIPRSQGGTTTIDNLVVIRSTHNRRMQDMNAHVYKKAFLAGQLG